jgi:DNA-binding transcriptional ArsR family regulator
MPWRNSQWVTGYQRSPVFFARALDNWFRGAKLIDINNKPGVFMDALALSSEMEDYLETIAALFRANGQARVTDIAERLSVSKAGVTQALRSLAGKGLVEYSPYISPTLTETGKRIAERVQHRHDVL